MNKKRAHIFTAEKPNMQLSRIISAITFIFERQNGYEVVDVIAAYNSNGCISQEATQEIFDAINEDDIDAVFLLTAEMISSHYTDIIQFIPELRTLERDLYSVAYDIYYQAMGEATDVFITEKTSVYQTILYEKDKDFVREIMYKIIFESETVIFDSCGKRIMVFPTEDEADESMDEMLFGCVAELDCGSEGYGI